MFVYRCVSVKRVSDLERHRESFVAPPVRRQHWAQKVGAVRPHELGGVVRDDLHHRPVVVLSESRHRGVLLLLRIAHLPHHRLKAAGRRTEPAAGARIYRNTHHNNVSKGKGTSKRHQTQSFRFKIDGICLGKVRLALSRKRKSWTSSVRLRLYARALQVNREERNARELLVTLWRNADIIYEAILLLLCCNKRRNPE